jgi:NADPH-dependent 2,4-dienoyl-CoA reductase/sulfur reductase-like enzyme
MAPMERLLVIGGDAAGMSAASQARRRRPPEELEIVAFERGNFTSFSACGIPYYVSEIVEDLDELVVRTPEEFKAKQSIDARVRHEVTSIDTSKGAIEVLDEDGGSTSWESYDQLLIGTGATPIRPKLDGVDAERIFGVQVLDDGAAIDALLDSEKLETAVVVGGGYIGLEMAEAFVRRGMKVAVVDQAPEPMTTLDPDMGALVGEAMRAMDIELYTGEAISGFETTDGKVSAVVTRERSLPAQIVILGLGARPNSALAEEAGIEIGPTGGIKVDRRMHTTTEGVWAAGDCAEKFHLVGRHPVAIALGTHANKEGRIAGINIGGGYATFPGVLGTAVSKICDVEVARTGLKTAEAESLGFEIESVVVDSTTRAGYFPHAAPIKTKLIVERMSGRLLGAQIVGKAGAAKRIDTLATALWNEMTVEEMLNMDLSYAPPFSPVWDPVLAAARAAVSKIESSRR